jgi:hypothetical protein
MNQNIIRVTYTIISLIGVYLAWSHYTEIVGESEKLNSFAYIGTVATLVGLLIAISEVLHNLHISKSIHKEASSLLKRVKQIENASSISDCLAAVDDVSSGVAIEDYKTALKSFHFFRKICVKVIPGFDIVQDGKLSALGELELFLIKATNTSPKAPLNKKQKTELIKKVLLIK